MKMKIILMTILLLSFSSGFASESYLCSISEVIEAKFKHGRWINTNVHDGQGVYRVVIDGKKATVNEKIAESNKLYPIETSCKFVGGTAGYVCKTFTKITPYGEKYLIHIYPELNEITIDAQYSMREMDAFNTKFKGENRKYFDDITMGFTKSYGKCTKY